MLILLAAAFIANIGYVVTARTTLVVMAVLLMLFGLRQFGWKGGLVASLVGAALASAIWASSPYLRGRVLLAVEQVQTKGASDVDISVASRLEYWRKSLALISEAPVIGHGTGTIPQLFRRDATAETNPFFIITNPHSQILAVALQLGLIGVVVLVAMWVAHLALFRDGTLVAWFGLVIVSLHVGAFPFNLDPVGFRQGWLYGHGRGLTGGMVLRGARGAAKGEVGTLGHPGTSLRQTFSCRTRPAS